MLEFQAFGGMDGGDGHTVHVCADTQRLQHGQTRLRVIGERGVLPSAIPANAIAQMLFLQCLAEDLLLCVDAGQNRTVGRRYPLRGEFGYAHGHALRLFRIAGVYGLCDPRALFPTGLQYKIVVPLR